MSRRQRIASMDHADKRCDVHICRIKATVVLEKEIRSSEVSVCRESPPSLRPCLITIDPVTRPPSIHRPVLESDPTLEGARPKNPFNFPSRATT